MAISFKRLGGYGLGRLGNQLWQCAATIALAERVGERPLFPSDWIYRPYFSLPDEFFTDEFPVHAVEATELAHHLDPRCRDYLQDFHIVRSSLKNIQSYFEVPASAQGHPVFIEEYHKFTDLFSKKLPIIGIHVRRGDKMYDPSVPNHLDYHLFVPPKYYTDAFDQLLHNETWPAKPLIAVWSDDVEWCKQNIEADYYGIGKPHLRDHEDNYRIEEPLDWIDLYLMSCCDALIITGSTFGIWAALISEISPSHVVRPNRVYGPLLDYIDSELLFNPDWRVQCF